LLPSRGSFSGRLEEATFFALFSLGMARTRAALRIAPRFFPGKKKEGEGRSSSPSGIGISNYKNKYGMNLKIGEFSILYFAQ
jgi:hypothetical protein